MEDAINTEEVSLPVCRRAQESKFQFYVRKPRVVESIAAQAGIVFV